ncbi:MAG TPA: radical SAM protein [Candidatus Methylomirabilis sp.]|nr:radical SAM protein [Candidatus Methylomirabilis sp.]
MTAPLAPFSHLASLWIQATGTWCNLECTHCFNGSGPREPWLKSLDAATVRRAILEAETLGVKEIYFTGGEPFLHPDLLDLLACALTAAPTTVLTNGTRITPTVADRLAALAASSPYSLEVRISLDDVDREKNDRVRGRGAFDKAVRALRLLTDRGLLPILTATEILQAELPQGVGLHERFRDFLLSLGVAKPRVKIIPVFAMGRLQPAESSLLSEETLEGFDRSLLQCTETRVVAAGGVYACPILAGLPGARLSTGTLAESLKPCALYHSACVTCYQTGMSCRNF